MSTLSKIINSQLKNYSCRALAHPGHTCTESAIYNLKNYLLSSLISFSPLWLFPLIMRIHKMNREIFWDHTSYYIEVCSGAYIFGNVIVLLACILRQINGKWSYYSLFFYPALLSSFSCFLLSDRVARMFVIYIYQVLFEAELRAKSNIISRAISESKILQTLLFMLCSSIIFKYLKENHKLKIFWFVKPNKNIKKSENENNLNLNNMENNEDDDKLINKNSKCLHEDNCMNHLKQGIKTYLSIGFCLEIVKSIFAKPIKKSDNIYEFILNKIRNLNFNAIEFLVSYVGLYRASNCLLNNYFDIKDNKVELISSLLGGISYYFYPKSIILAYSVTITLEILFGKFIRKYKNSSVVIKKISKMNIAKFLISPGMALMIHLYVFRNHLISNIGGHIINAATNFKTVEIRSRFQSILGGYKF